MNALDVGAAPETRSNWGTFLLLGAVVVAAIGGAAGVTTHRAFELDRFFVPKELALHVGALLAVVALGLRRGPREWHLPDLALVVWLACTAAATLGATSGWHASRALAVTASSAMLYWAAAELRAAGLSRATGAVVAIGAVVAAGSSLAQAYGVDSGFFSANRAPGGFLGNRNFVAHVAAMTLPLLIWLTATSRAAVGISLGVVGMLANMTVLVLSRTRAAWLALAVSTVVAAAVAFASRDVARAATVPRRGRLIVGTIVVGVIAALIVPNSLDWRSDSPYLDSVKGVVNYRAGSGAGRLVQYSNSLKLTRAHPLLGVGPGNWAAEYPTVADRNDPSLSDATGMASNPWPSSDWVAALSERGIPAALAFAAFAAILLLNAWRGWRDSVYASRDRLAALAGGSVVLVAALEGMFDAVSLLAYPSVCIAVAAGALIPAGRTRFVTHGTPRQRGYLTAVAAAVWLVFVAMSVGKIEAMRQYSTGTLAGVRRAAALDPESYRLQMRAAEMLAQRGNCRLAFHNATAAYKLFPHSTAAAALVARCSGAAPQE